MKFNEVKKKTTLNKFKATFTYSMAYSFYLITFPNADFHSLFLFTAVGKPCPPSFKVCIEKAQTRVQ